MESIASFNDSQFQDFTSKNRGTILARKLSNDSGEEEKCNQSFNSCIDISISSKQEIDMISQIMQTPFEDEQVGVN
jgi:hypothetical protein